jgi:hypothetical protein
MIVNLDPERGKEVAKLLYEAYTKTGIFGKKEMPEDILPKGMTKGSREHVLFITFTVAIDYLREADELWESARRTYEDPETRYLFYPEKVYETSFEKIKDDIKKHNLSWRVKNDVRAWKTLGTTFWEKWKGDPLNFIKDCNDDAELIWTQLQNKKENHYYPKLRGPKIGPLWIRMLRDNIGLELKNLDKIPIPVDTHVIRATLATGVIRGEFKTTRDKITKYTQEVWFESFKKLHNEGIDLIPLNMDKPLWHLSKNGCYRRDKITGDCPYYSECIAKEFCVKGMIKIKDNIVEVNT